MLLMGKSTISMAMFNSFLYVYQAGYPIDGVNYPQSLATYSGWDDPPSSSEARHRCWCRYGFEKAAREFGAEKHAV